MSTVTRRAMLGAAAAGTAAALIPRTSASASTGAVKPLIDAQLEQAISSGLPGLVIGAFDGRDEHVGGAGTTSGPGSSAPDGRTVYQLGSITKTITALLLAEAVERRLVRLDDPIARYLPRELMLPKPLNGEITLRHVATQSSGLPSLPPNLGTLPGFDPLDPYAAYTERNLADGLRATTLVHEPGTAYLYSNLGFALLGRAMADLVGTGYADAVRRFVAKPLRLGDTTAVLTAEQAARKATGHSSDGTAVPDWHLPTFAGAGALYGTLDDLMRYLHAMSGQAPGALRPALKRVQQPLFTLPDSPAVRVALAWHIQPLPTSGRTLIWHNGETGGFTSFTGFCPETGIGVAVLTNAAAPATVNTAAVTVLEGLGARHSR